jgi:hypothetical protein
MAIITTQALVLRRWDLRETSLLVNFFTQGHGKVSGELKGIRADPRKFASSADIFSLNDIVFYQKRNSSVHLVSQCDLRESFPMVRKDLRLIGIASSICELLDGVMAPEDATLRTDLNVFATFDPKLPEAYRCEPYLFLGNIQPSLQKNVRSQMIAPKITGGDTMNYWIESARAELVQTISEWDFLLINDSEARLLSGKYNLRQAAAAIFDMGPQTLVVKRGEYGAILFRRDGHFIVPGYLLEDVFDPTGAGDSFAGGFFGYLASQGVDPADPAATAELRRAIIYGSVMGSYCCERFGVDRFRNLTRAEIDARYAEFKAFTEF